MQTIGALFRFFFLEALLCSITSALVYLFGPKHLFWLGAVSIFSLSLLLMLFSERLLAWIHRVTVRETPIGLRRSLEAALKQPILVKAPRILIFPDPAPNAFVARSLFGKGSIFLSQGLVVLLNEQELRAVLLQSVKRVNEPATLLQSFCAVLASWILKPVKPGWMQANPIKVLFSFIFLSLGQALLRIGGSSRSHLSEKPEFADAVRKIEQSLKIWQPEFRPGIQTLYLSTPQR